MRDATTPEPLNRGVQNTEQEPLMKSLIDWCSFTVTDRSALAEVFSMMGISLNTFVQVQKGKNYYKVQHRFGNIVILSDGMPGMGIHVEMSGQGCREFDSSSGRWRDLLSKIIKVGGRFSRIDAALDDHKGHFTLEEIEGKIQRREVRSLFKKFRIIDDYNLADESGHNGKTIYCGSANSEIQVRIYDKAAQQKVENTWIRTEVVCRNEHANMLARYICETDNLGEIIGGILKNYLAFIDPSADSNRARWPVSSWWNKFQGAVERVKLTIKRKVKHAIQVIKNFFIKPIAPTSAQNLLSDGGDTGLLARVVSHGENQLTLHHLELLDTDRQSMFTDSLRK
jgi:phage replication initiation protein